MECGSDYTEFLHLVVNFVRLRLFEISLYPIAGLLKQDRNISVVVVGLKFHTDALVKGSTDSSMFLQTHYHGQEVVHSQELSPRMIFLSDLNVFITPFLSVRKIFDSLPINGRWQRPGDVTALISDIQWQRGRV